MGKATLSIIGILASEGTFGIVIVGAGGALSLYQYREKHPLTKELTIFNLNKMYMLINMISHHEDILQYHKDLKSDFISRLKKKCSCAIENA